MFDRADVRILESSKSLSEKVVVAARLHCGKPLAEAGKRERVVAHGADVMLSLPDTPAFDARARVERVGDAPPDAQESEPESHSVCWRLRQVRSLGGSWAARPPIRKPDAGGSPAPAALARLRYEYSSRSSTRLRTSRTGTEREQERTRSRVRLSQARFAPAARSFLSIDVHREIQRVGP